MSNKVKETIALNSILIGDEIGLLKKIDYRSSMNTSNLITLNRDKLSGEPSPDKSILSIRPFNLKNENLGEERDHPMEEEDEIDEDDDSDDDNKGSNKYKKVINKGCFNNETSNLFLITSKPSTLRLYNSNTDQLNEVQFTAKNSQIIGAEPINNNNIVMCYSNGTIDIENIDRDICKILSFKKKAINLLGLDLNKTEEISKNEDTNSRRSRLKDIKKSATISASTASSSLSAKRTEFMTNRSSSTPPSFALSSNIFSPNWNPSSNLMTCFKTCGTRLAIAGKGIDLKVFDLSTKQIIFNAKPSNRDWLGLLHPTWVTDLDWIGPTSKLHSLPSMVITCSRSDPIVRIFDIRERQRKPTITMNFKDSTFNCDSNPPAFTTICSTEAPDGSYLPTQQIILGTTLGRMLAVDLRYNSRSHRQLGVFKGFSGGAIKDIKLVHHQNFNHPNMSTYKLISCSLDRFLRVHNFSSSGKETKRHLDVKVYTKTRPTCIQPICTSFPYLEDSYDDLAPIDDDDDDNENDYENDDNHF